MLCGSNIRISTQITETLPSAKVKWILFCYVLQMSWSCITLLQFIFFFDSYLNPVFLGHFSYNFFGIILFLLSGRIICLHTFQLTHSIYYLVCCLRLRDHWVMIWIYCSPSFLRGWHPGISSSGLRFISIISCWIEVLSLFFSWSASLRSFLRKRGNLLFYF